MARTRTVLAGLGISLLLGMGIATFSPAQPAGGEASGKNDRQALRQQIVKLRADIEVLQLERDATRANLLEAMTRVKRVELIGKTHFLTPVGLDQLKMWTITGSHEQAKSIDDALATLTTLGEIDEREMQVKAEQDIKKLDEAIRLSIDFEKKQFVNLVTELNEKALDLADAEKWFNGSR